MLDGETYYPVGTFNQYSLTSFGYTQKEIETLFPPEVMEQIARKLRKLYSLTVSIPHMRQAIAEVVGDTRLTAVDDYPSQYSVLSFSKLSLQCLSIPREIITSVTDEDMHTICNVLIGWYDTPEGFTKLLEHFVTVFLVGRGWEWEYNEDEDRMVIIKRPPEQREGAAEGTLA